MWPFVTQFLTSHVSTLIGFTLALLITAHLVIEKRSPSNIFAWGLFILFAPTIGTPLFFLLSGRKNRKLVRIKREILKLAAKLTPTTQTAETVEKNSTAPFLPQKCTGNTFTLLASGTSTLTSLQDNINSAKESIFLMTYVFGHDATGKQLLELLCRRAREGITVKVLIDAFGSLGCTRSFIRPLRKAGGHIVRFLPALPLQLRGSAHLRNHRKVAIFDQKRAILGGHNLENRCLQSSECPKKAFHDFSGIVEGPIVATLNRVFISDWCFATKSSPMAYSKTLAYNPPACGSDEVKVIASGPDYIEDPLWEQILTIIQECRRELLCVTPYFVPDEVVFRSLLIKAHAGAKIRLITPEKSNQNLVNIARHHYLRELAKAGVEILLYHPKMLHAKLIIADKKIALMGSANLDIRSFFLNFEIGIVHTSPQPVKELQAWAKNLLPDCRPYQDSRHYHATKNRRFIEDFAHLLVPLL